MASPVRQFASRTNPSRGGIGRARPAASSDVGGTRSAANLDMSRRCAIALMIVWLFAAQIATAASSVSVFFIGNSLTQANNLPEVFKQFAAASSLDIRVEVHSLTPGGALFYDHWKRGEASALLRQYHPNFLVLQGQSTEPLFSPQNFSYYAGLFKIEADRLGTTTVLFSTWARPAGDPFYKDPLSGGSPAEMQTQLNTAYASLAQNLGVKLTPVGLAWEKSHRDAADIELLDGTQHPSMAGTYLAAAVLFRTLFSTDAVNSSYYGGLPKETALRLQRIAGTVLQPNSL
jgi:hypothetical protein